MPRIDLAEVAARYGSDIRLRIHEISFQEGERVVIVGPSGSGKSTLLRMLAGLRPPDVSGQILFDGVDVKNTVPAVRKIGYVFQEFALYPHLSIFDNIALSLRFACKHDNPHFKAQQIPALVEEVARWFEIEELLSRRPMQVSGGQQQRVALARAIVRGRELRLLLMDEPLSDLDGGLRLRTRECIIARQEEFQTTLLYVTHDRAEAMAVGHRILILRAGAVEQFDTPARVYRSPATLFCASFLGELPLNVFQATVENDRIQFGGTSVAAPESALALGQGSQLILGIRPELIPCTPRSDSLVNQSQTVCVIAQRIEVLGSRSLIHGRLPGGDPVLFAVGATLIDSGCRHFALNLDASRYLMFDRNEKLMS